MDLLASVSIIDRSGEITPPDFSFFILFAILFGLMAALFGAMLAMRWSDKNAPLIRPYPLFGHLLASILCLLLTINFILIGLIQTSEEEPPSAAVIAYQIIDTPFIELSYLTFNIDLSLDTLMTEVSKDYGDYLGTLIVAAMITSIPTMIYTTLTWVGVMVVRQKKGVTEKDYLEEDK